MGGQCLAAPPIALIGGTDPAVSLIADGNASAAVATEKQPLEKRPAFPGRSYEQRIFCVDLVTIKKLLVLHELLPRDIPFMVIPNQNGLIRDGHLSDPRTKDAIRSDLLDEWIPHVHGYGLDGFALLGSQLIEEAL